MTRELIETRLAELRQNLKQVLANANAISGAIEDCEFWLAVLEQEANKERAGVPTPAPEGK